MCLYAYTRHIFCMSVMYTHHLHPVLHFVYSLRCSVLQCVAVCCGALQCVAVHGNACLALVPITYSLWCSVLQGDGVCCRVMQCVAG